MRTRFVLALSALTTVLLLPTASAAQDGSFKAVTTKAPASHAATARPQCNRRPAAALWWKAARSRTVATPRARIAARAEAGPTCTVTGTVLAFDGSSVANADVEWSYYDANDRHVFGAQTKTDAAGRFGFNDVAVSNRGRLTAWLSDGKTKFRRGHLAFVPGANDYVLRPGALTVQATRSNDPKWNGWTTMDTDFYGASNAAVGEIAGSSGRAFAMAPYVYYGIVSFWNNEAVEWQTSSPIPIVTGVQTSTTVSVDETDALRVLVGDPRWGSGRPGATIGYDLINWPAGYQATVAGYGEDPDHHTSVRYDGEWTSTGGAGRVALAVPAQATPGYAFDIQATRSDNLWSTSDLRIYCTYQVCTLLVSKTTIRRGASIIAGGVIPTQGHWGADAGISKTVTLYSHKGIADVPAQWDPSGEGWRKVGSIRSDGFGRYRSAPFRPRGTLTLVVRYPGDDWYWGAYTSVRKVKVK